MTGISCKEEPDGLNQPCNPAEPDGLNQPEVAKEHRAVVANHVNTDRSLETKFHGSRAMCWDANSPCWDFHGTPAGCAGIHGCFELGSSVVGLCHDEHHRDNLGRFLLQRAAEAMVAGTTAVFKDEVLQTRSAEMPLQIKFAFKAKGQKPRG